MYKVIVWKRHRETFSFREPMDALLCGIDYLRKGYQVRLNDATVEELVMLDRRSFQGMLAGARYE